MQTKQPDATPIPIRITLLEPPPGVGFMVQRGAQALLAPSLQEPSRISFDLSLRLGPPLPDGRPNFLGEYAQGPRGDRFIYVNSGVRAGQRDSGWDRRAKIKLSSIDGALLERLFSEPGLVLEACIQGKSKDGGPACATVPILGGWRLQAGLSPSAQSF